MSVVDAIVACVNVARISVPTAVESLWNGTPPEVVDERLRWWGRTLVRDAEIHLSVEGQDHFGNGDEAFVVMSNHESLYDVPVLFATIPGRVRMAAKAELFHVPVWGRAMASTGFIPLDRKHPKDAVHRLREKGKALLAAGTRLWIAPEGTRSRTGKLGPFKTGGFRLAIECGVRIVPVAIVGTRHVTPPGTFSVRRGRQVSVSVLPPIDTAFYGLERLPELSAQVRAAIQNECDRLSVRAAGARQPDLA